MSDHQNPATELTGASEGPDAKKPCLIDTPPVAGTPDNASDFYNTPLTGGTPALTESAQVAEASSASLPHPSIPGLNLVDHPTEQDTIMETEPTIKQEGQDLAANQEGSQNPPQPQVSDAAIKEEAETTQVKREQNALVDDVMEIVETQDGNMIDADVKNENEDEHPEWEVDSSPYESSSDSSDSSDSDDSDDEDYPIMSAEEQAKILMHAEGGSDDEGDGKGKSGANLRTTNEIEHEVLPLPDVQITPEMKIVFLGKIHAAIDNNVLIEANTSGEYQVLESGSLLCSDDRKIIGVVAETLGRVENPLYTMTYKTAAEVEEKGLVKGIDIFYVVDHSTFVFTQPLKGLKGSDASNFHDEEVAAEEMEFSDDEEEAEYKRKLKQKRQERKEARDGPKGKKAAPGPSKLNQTELNYDDAGAEGYTPLERPTNLHEMMGAREAPIEGNERGGHRGRGRGRGDRGRGGRGRGGAGRGGRDWDHERRPHQSHEPQNQTQPQHQQQPPQPQPAPYGQPAYGMPQPFAAYAAQYGQQQAQNPQFAQQQPQFGQGGPQPQYPFQFPFQQPQMQPGGFQGAPQGAPHINPLFLAALQQQQQYQQQPQQYQQYQPQYQQPQQHQPQQQQQQQQQPPQGQAPPMGFDQVKAQLDLLRSLSQGNQGPPPS